MAFAPLPDAAEQAEATTNTPYTQMNTEKSLWEFDVRSSAPGTTPTTASGRKK